MDNDFWNLLDKLISESEIVIDRPKGSSHPCYPSFSYEVDYGYLKDSASMDGDGIDVWLGSKNNRIADAILCAIDLTKRDSEIKILIGCTKQEKELIYEVHNATSQMKAIMLRR